MITKLARYEVHKGSVPQATAAVREFVDQVKRKEGGTARYEAWQSADGTQFTHLMAFRVASAEQYHQKTAWAKKFHETLAPLLAKPFEVVDAAPVE
jgi:quinol monooxygenase YgiN